MHMLVRTNQLMFKTTRFIPNFGITVPIRIQHYVETLPVKRRGGGLHSQIKLSIPFQQKYENISVTKLNM